MEHTVDAPAALCLGDAERPSGARIERGIDARHAVAHAEADAAAFADGLLHAAAAQICGGIRQRAPCAQRL